MIRAFFALLAAVIYCILSIPILLVETLIRKKWPEAAEKSLLRIVQFALTVVRVICGTKITTKGLENIPEDEAVLFVGNHQSYFDVIISFTQMKNRCGYIAKNNLEKVPVLRWNMRFLHCLFLDREDVRQGLQTILTAIEEVKSGISIFVFPEGTRNKGDETELLEFHRGSFKIAQRSGCKIIPVSFNNTASIFEKQFPAVRRTHVVVEYGKPITYAELTKEEQKHIDEYFRNIISDMVKKNQAEV